MAEAFCQKYSKNFEVKIAGYSHGYWEWKNLDSTQHVKFCMDESGINVRNKISKKITLELLNWED